MGNRNGLLVGNRNGLLMGSRNGLLVDSRNGLLVDSRRDVPRLHAATRTVRNLLGHGLAAMGAETHESKLRTLYRPQRAHGASSKTDDESRSDTSAPLLLR
jgi:hypothetical protein